MSPPGSRWTKEEIVEDRGGTSVQVMEKAASFKINGKSYQVSGLPVSTSLNTFIRDHAHLKGTKYMCQEGGCGACIVSVTALAPGTGKSATFAANSCLVPIYNCHGWSIKTVEALGNRHDGYGNVQTRLASNNGTQCGYCSPGMVMNMYSLMQDNKELTMKEIENSFGGNICRCTGYRPILDAFKSFAKDAPKELIDRCVDIEECASEICPKTGKECSSTCDINCNDTFNTALIESSFHLNLDDGKNWYRVTSLKEIFEILNMIDDNSYTLVGGNTAYGVYRPTTQRSHYIDVNQVPELHSKDVSDSSIILGANVSLTNAMKFFYEVAERHKNNFGYAKQLADHIDLIANVPVRNTGTLAGNLSIKNQHKEFPSDIFLILETVGTQLVIADLYGMETTIPLMQYLSTNMNKKIITKIVLPCINSNEYNFKTYKIMPRSQNAHAYVNAGFLFKLDKKDRYKVQEKPSIVFGGIHPEFVHARQTEAYLNGKQLSDPKVVQDALNTLSGELFLDHVLPDASPEYRKGLAISLLYKFILSLCPDNLSPSKKSGGELLTRPLSSAKQDFETDQTLWPLNKPVPKVEAYSQCSGEAQYVNDIPNFPGELYGAVITAKKATATSFTLDPKTALKMPGVVACYTAKDIPGHNDFMPQELSPGFKGEEVFASKNILFAGQALGVIVAETQAIAIEAAEKVKIEYQGVSKPKIDFVDVVKSQDKTRITEKAKIEPKERKGDVKHKVSGTFLIRSQYHYTMETQTCLSVPVEDGLDVYPASQWASMVQWTVANVLKLKENSINVNVRRLGGAYGSKISRNNQISAISALSAHLLKRPVRVTLNLETNMQMVGKRFPCYIEYEAGVNNDGKFQYLEGKLYQDVGATENESDNVGGTIGFLPNTYDSDTWSVVAFAVRTDTPSNTWCRAPGSTEAVSSIEHIIEHIANVVKKDPLSVRLANLKSESSPVLKMIDDIKLSSNFEKRVTDVETFNSANRWKKRGISLVPLNYPFAYWGRYHANVSVFAEDGTVAISHGGIESGQGLNTKAAQVCAYVLGIPLDFVKIKPTMTIIAPNNSTTGGSITSEAVSFAVQKACEEINKRLEPIKATMPGAKWQDVVKAANNKDVNLNVNYMYKNNESLSSYIIFGVTVLEVEVDVLTGQHQITRVDLIEDAGQSLSPDVDIGQVEGAFVMGLGYFLSEELIYDKETGKLLTDRTWNYKPPGAKDIPIDFRVTLLKNSRNLGGVLRSKATGEPPLNMSCSVIFAIRNALESARKDSGITEDWFNLQNPLTCEHTWLSGSTAIKDMTL